MIRCKKNRSNDANDISTMLAHLPHCVCSSLETVPAEQEVQEAAPVCFVIEFWGHLVQIVTVLSLYVPALHSTVDDNSIQLGTKCSNAWRGIILHVFLAVCLPKDLFK